MKQQHLLLTAGFFILHKMVDKQSDTTNNYIIGAGLLLTIIVAGVYSYNNQTGTNAIASAS